MFITKNFVLSIALKLENQRSYRFVGFLLSRVAIYHQPIYTFELTSIKGLRYVMDDTFVAATFISPFFVTGRRGVVFFSLLRLNHSRWNSGETTNH